MQPQTQRRSLTSPLTEEECAALVARYVPNGDVYPLWGFIVNNQTRDSSGFIVNNRMIRITRGRTAEEAQEYIQMFEPPGAMFELLECLPMSMAEHYSINHADGWMERPPIWVLRRMFGV